MLKIIFTIILSLLFIKSITAQYKIGTVNTNVVFNKMIEVENLNDILKRYQDSLFQVATQKEKDLDEQTRAWSGNCDDCPPPPDSIKKKTRQKLIEQITANMNFRELIETLCKNKSDELINPLRKRLKDAVRQIAAENNYYYVLDMSDEHLSFLPLPPCENITELVLCRLNL